MVGFPQNSSHKWVHLLFGLRGATEQGHCTVLPTALIISGVLGKGKAELCIIHSKTTLQCFIIFPVSRCDAEVPNSNNECG